VDLLSAQSRCGCAPAMSPVLMEMWAGVGQVPVQTLAWVAESGPAALAADARPERNTVGWC
jgi:hypothetical protein